MVNQQEELRQLRALNSRQRQMLQELNKEIEKRDAELKSMHIELADARGQMLRMRQTLSWKITRPLRVVQMMAR
ncbi:hypothetical protein [Arcanobacterium haemolyticum]|uniref:hypothetical protein n=1 Tax=Arcanobacterium haemolyticum TaxID=28264 RepID=UPI0011BEC633|nr:hypothetical protein [Arcanobacterium haemolyticum]